MKYFLTIALIFILFKNLHAQTVNPGDVIITGMNCKDPDQFCFLITQPINGNEIIYFTDCGWDNANGFRVGEGLITYTVPSFGLAQGTWVTYPNDPGFTTQGISGFFGLSTDGDQIYCFTGGMNNPYFISALNLDGINWAITPTNNQTGARPPINVNFCPAIPEADNAVWDCQLQTEENLFDVIGNPVHWIHSDTRQLLPPVCSWVSLGIDTMSVTTPEENVEIVTILFYRNEQIHSYILEEIPLTINLYTIEGRSLVTVPVKMENPYLYSAVLPDISYHICIMEIITGKSVFRTLISIP